MGFKWNLQFRNFNRSYVQYTKLKGVAPTGATFFFGDHTAWWKHLFPFRTQ
jgi:hypothetical protein